MRELIAAPTTGGVDEGRTPWLTVEEAAERARCGIKVIYRAVKMKRLKATKVDGRRTLRFLPEWIDEWLMTSVTIH